MDITSLNNLKVNKTSNIYNLFEPNLYFFSKDSLTPYKVVIGEEMRIDLIIMSIYDDIAYLKDADVILFINNIDLALNINVGDIIYYPPPEALDSYRFIMSSTEYNRSDSIISKLSTPNKTTRIDKNRKEYIDKGYSLPPVVIEESKHPVRVEGDSIIIGGIN